MAFKSDAQRRATMAALGGPAKGRRPKQKGAWDKWGKKATIGVGLSAAALGAAYMLSRARAASMVAKAASASLPGRPLLTGQTPSNVINMYRTGSSYRAATGPVGNAAASTQGFFGKLPGNIRTWASNRARAGRNLKSATTFKLYQAAVRDPRKFGRNVGHAVNAVAVGGVLTAAHIANRRERAQNAAKKNARKGRR